MRSPFKKKSNTAPGKDKMVFPSDRNYIAAKQREQRRQLRLLQVRKISNETAARVRQRVRDKQVQVIEKLASEELAKYITFKEAELAKLEADYQNALAQVGLGHEGLRELQEYERWKEEQKRLQAEVAGVRGEHALKTVRHQEMLNRKLKENMVAVKKSVIMTEKLRAAAVRKGRQVPLNKVEVIEIDPRMTDGKKVRFVDRNKIISGNGNAQAVVRRIDSRVQIGTGLEEAISEQLKEMSRDEKARKEIRDSEIARRRGEEAIRRLRLERCLHNDEMDSSGDRSERSDQIDGPDASLSKSQEKSRVSEMGSQSEGGNGSDTFSDVERRFRKLIRKGFESEDETQDQERDVDLTPERGPRSLSEYSSSSSSLHATVSRPHDDVDHHRQASMSPRKEVDEFKKFLAGPGAIKTSEADKNFVAKVLDGLNLSNDLVDVKVDVEEVSTLSSSVDVRHLVEGSPDSESIHALIDHIQASDTMEEHERQQKLRLYIEQLLRMKRQEIADLSVSTVTESTFSTGETSSGTTSLSSATPSLSVSSPSVSTSSKDTSRKSSSLSSKCLSISNSDSGHFVSSTPASASSTSGSKSSATKTVRFRDEYDGSFVSAVDPSIEEKKRQIFEQTQLSLQEISRQYIEQRQIIEQELDRRHQRKLKKAQSKVTISSGMDSDPLKEGNVEKDVMVSQSFEEVQHQPDKDVKSFQDFKENLVPQLSEGPLSGSRTSSSGLSLSASSLSDTVRRRVLSSRSASGVENLSSTSGTEMDPEEVERVRSEREIKIKTQKRIRKMQLDSFTRPESTSPKLDILLVNKSSSSGTSGSAATIEFLARLRDMEMPTLRRPTPDQLQGLAEHQVASSGQNTSADLAKLKDLESSKAS